MLSPTEPTPEQMLTAMARTGRAHVSVSQGALPFVVPCTVRLEAGDLVIDTSHPSVTRGAARHDIAALQAEAAIGDTCWSLSVTGPLDARDDASPAGSRARAGEPSRVILTTRDALFRAECLSSPHGHRLDPLQRSGLAERA